MPSVPLLSVIIPTHNNLAVLQRCLASWKQYAALVPIEILVIEDGCSDGTSDFLVNESGTPWGKSHLRWFHENDVHELKCDNRGFQEARGEFLLAWQDDMFLECSWLVPELASTLRKHTEIGLIALSRGLLLHPVDEPINTWEELMDWRRLESTIGPRFWNWFKLYEVDAVCRPWMVRKACLDKVGLLDEAFAPCEWDEADLCYRLRHAGWKITTHGYERDGAYQHLGSTTIGKMPSEKHKAIALRNGRLFHERWGGRVREEHQRSRQTWRRSLDAAGLRQTTSQFLKSLVKR